MSNTNFSKVMKAGDPRLREIWKQKEIPVIYRRGGKQPLMVHLPFGQDNRSWLKKDIRKKEPVWDGKFSCWHIPKTRFNELVKDTLVRYSRVYVIQPYREQEKCAPACWNAEGFECECSCMGENHGSGNPNGRWFVISETLAVSWQDREYGCRLIERTSEFLQPRE